MNAKNRLANDIERTKKKLRLKVKKIGLWENFGQKEVRRLTTTYDANSLCYGTPEEREMYNHIELFNTWCMNYEPLKV